MTTEETSQPTTETNAAQVSDAVPTPRQSLEAAQKRLAEAEGAETEGEPGQAPEAAEKAKRAAKQSAPNASAEVEQQRAQLKELAAKLGMTVEDRSVTATERYNLREEKRQNMDAIRQAEADAIRRVGEARAEWEPKIKRAEDFDALAKKRDHEGLAKHLGFESWNALQDDFIQHEADPNYKRVRELEERLRKEDEQKAKDKEEGEKQAASRAELEAQANYKRGLQQTMGQSQDPLVKAMAEMPNFINAIFNVQRRVFQESGGRDAITAEAALRLVPQGGTSLYDEMKQLHDKLAPVFAPKAAPPAGTVEKPKPKTSAAAPPVPAPAPRERAPFVRGFSEEQRARMSAAIAEDRRRA